MLRTPRRASQALPPAGRLSGNGWEGSLPNGGGGVPRWSCLPGRRGARPEFEGMTRRKPLQGPDLVVGAVLGQDGEAGAECHILGSSRALGKDPLSAGMPLKNLTTGRRVARAEVGVGMRLFGKKRGGLLPVTLPVPSFSSAWALGKFDGPDYYALTAPVTEWGAAYPTHCLSEAAEGVCDAGWGIVTWKLTVYVYSSVSMAQERAGMLGGKVKPLKLKCLSCFARAFSNSYAFVDMVLDESWHMEAYVCRDQDMTMPGVTHLRLSAPDGLFQLQGCQGNKSLEWIQYPQYGVPNHPTEWCRPVAFPAGRVVHDHGPQGGPIDLEMLSDPECLAYYFVDGTTLARDDSGNEDVIFTRPTGPVAFANIMGEPVRLTRGEGVWIPVAVGLDGDLRIPEWAEDYKPHVNKILSGEAGCGALCRGCQWHVNMAMALLEHSHLDGEATDVDRCEKAVQAAIEHLEKAVRAKPWDWYAKTLLRDARAASAEEIPALIHADRCGWLASTGDFDQLEEERELAMAAKPNYHLAMYLRALARRACGDNDACDEGLGKLVGLHPQHAQALFDLGVSALMAGDEEREMEFYSEAIEADPTFAPPYYNIGKTYEDGGDTVRAMQYYGKTLKNDPHYIEAAEQLAGIMWEDGGRESAAKVLFACIQSDPHRDKTYQVLIRAARALGDEELFGATMQALRENLPRKAAEILDGGDE